MGIRFERHKPRVLLASVAYKLQLLAPGRFGLGLLLDLEWIAGRLAHERATRLGLARRDDNEFLLGRISPGDHVLDLGCGVGDVAASIRTAQVVGVDHCLASIQEAKRRHPSIEFIHGDARDYFDSDFNVLILSHVLEHLDEPEEILASLGSFERIYVEVPDFDASPRNELRKRLGRRLIYSDNDHVAEFDRKELEAMFSKAGLGIIDREFIGGVMKYWVAPVRQTSLIG